MKMKFGVRLPHCGPFTSVENVKDAALHLEKIGFDSAWTNDYVVWTKALHDVHMTAGSVEALPRHTDPDYFESLSTLAYLSGITQRLELGVAVLVAPYRHPVTTARQLSTIDALSNGRLIAGFGVGACRQTKNPNFDVLQIPIEDKLEITAEYLRVIRMLMRDGEASYQGKFVSFEDAVILPKPIRGYVPMWMGGSAKAALRVAAESCDGWMPTWFAPEDYAAKRPMLEEMLANNDRTIDDFTLAREIYLCLDEDSARAKNIARATIENNARWFTVRGLKEFDERLDLAQRSSLIGDPDEVTRKIKEYVAVGVSHLEFKVIFHDWPGFRSMMELFATEVIPAVNG